MDAMHKAHAKDWSASVCYPCGDGWNAWGYGKTQKRHEGRKKMRREARRRLKNDLKNWSREY